jgi:hypothetical protein
MKKNFKFTNYSKFIFIIKYIYHKITLFKDVKRGVRKIYLAELIWLVNQIFKIRLSLPNIFNDKYFVTKYGKFYVTNDLISTVTVSPAFERRDIEMLLDLIATKIKNKKNLLFIDIGANFGLYTVIVGNRFKGKNIKIVSFEPNTTYLSSPAFNLLKSNIKLNNIKNVKLYKLGIGSKKMKIKDFDIAPLSSVLTKNTIKKYDSIFIKLDVDDYVLDALVGIQDCVDNSKEVILLVEDFVDKNSIKYLDKNWKFIDKLTSYNSFWINK